MNTITDQDLREHVVEPLLGEFAADYDIDAIMADLLARWPLSGWTYADLQYDHPEFDSEEFDEIAQRHDWQEIGRQAFRNGDMAAPALNAQVRTAIADKKVGDPVNLRIMQAFTRGYDHVREEQAQAVLVDTTSAVKIDPADFAQVLAALDLERNRMSYQEQVHFVLDWLFKLDPAYSIQRHTDDGQLYWLTEQEHADGFQPGPERRVL
jgi:hypothetical protein